MSSRCLTLGTIVVVALLVMSGCSRPIVKQPGPGGQGFVGTQTGGPFGEGDLQVVQANLKPIYFEYDSFTLNPEAQAAAQYNLEIIRRAPQFNIVAEGHCDERGTSEYNLALGDRRARAVVEYMSTLGIPPSKCSTVSYGSELPVDPGHNEDAWAKNRRVYLRVSR
ncbi:MAG: OmpA family protein [Desulfomonile tiedjei]|uniref:Peptidoglycan-associated lipoprotein n=1 Tax=Desulfomonile tiedjei TaxID=2358 RepID=A0A9D6UZD2_9BACT|nr:OmpA family protein [Desulfomonile tiedjei]